MIEGASQGAGLGHDFLRHIERTRVLLHLVEATGDDPIGAYQTIRQELTAYSESLVTRPQILALSKIDAVDDEEVAEIAQALSEVAQQEVFLISSATRTGLEPLLAKVWQQLDLLAAERAAEKLALERAAFPVLK